MLTIPPCTTVFGVPGNILIVIVFYRGTCGLSITARFYYIAMAILGNIALLTFYFTQFLETLPPLTHAVWLPDGSAWACKLSTYLGITSDAIANWTLTVLNLERLYVLSCPIRSRLTVTLKRAIIIISVIATVIYDYFISILFTVEPLHYFISAANWCMTTNNLAAIIYSFGDTILVMVPPVIDAICTTALIILVVKITRNGRTLRTIVDDGFRTRIKEISATLTLLPISLTYCVFYLTDFAFYSVAMHCPCTTVTATEITIVSLILLATRSVIRCISFAVFLMRMHMFRAHVRKIMCCSTAVES